MKVINKATDGEPKNLINAGVNLNIPKMTWLYMATAITVPAVIIIFMLILKEQLNKYGL